MSFGGPYYPTGMACPKCGYLNTYCICPKTCSKCGKNTFDCKCYTSYGRRRFDMNCELWCIPEVKIEKKPEHEHDHSKRSLLLTTNWEDVAALWCENLITLGKYKKACELRDMKVIKNKTMHNYILTRLDNIEGCYSCLFLNGKMNEQQYKHFEFIQGSMKTYLKGRFGSSKFDDQFIGIGIWSSAKLFDNYLSQTLNSDFFKENDIRIENCTF